MFTDQNGNMYQGDMRSGDREASVQEIEAYESVRNAPPTPIEQIRAIEQSTVVTDALQRASRLVALAYALDDVLRIAVLKGQTVTRDQAHSWAMLNDSTYLALYEAEQVIKPLRELL